VGLQEIYEAVMPMGAIKAPENIDINGGDA